MRAVKAMLGARYDSDGRPGFALSPGEKAGLALHLQKLAAGVYSFERSACPVCRRAGGAVLSRKDRYGIPFTVVICEECGLIRTDPRMDARSYTEFYRDEYRALYSGTAAPDEAFFVAQVRHGEEIRSLLLQQGCGLRAGDLVVEVGCGAGGILEAFRAGGAHVMGCDPGAEFLRFGREEKRLDLHVGFLRDLPLPRKARVVIYSHVMEHILDIRAELALLREVLAEDGVVYVEVPSVKNIHRDGYDGDLLRLLQNAHTCHFSARSLKNLFAVNGYAPVFIDEQCRAVFRVAAPGAWLSDHDEVLRFLRRAELTRLFYPLRPGPFYRRCARCLPGWLKCFLKRLIGRAAAGRGR